MTAATPLLTILLRAAGRLPAWVVRLLLAALAVLGLLAFVSRRREDTTAEADRFELEASQPLRRPGQRLIHVAGPAKVGKSTLANALLGASIFGPEAPLDQTAQYRGLWHLHELPPSALSLADAALLREQLLAGDVVVLLLDEQLYRLEGRFLDLLLDQFPDLTAVVMVNKEDLLLRRYTAAEAELVRQAVRAEVGQRIGASRLCWGSAAGPDGPDLAALRTVLDEVTAGT
ncbi:MAG: GTPase domain-containing protein [Fimbriimonadaceae bacterium]|nr:GTPase domain-containing protein [Fimbriimonadaceae bacterium]